MGYTKIWLHIIICKDNNPPYLFNDKRSEMIAWLKKKCDKKGMLIEAADGDERHCHFLLGMGNQYSVNQVVNLLFEESKIWQQTYYPAGSVLTWEDKYFAVSVSESQVEKVKKYIAEENKRHPRIHYKDEFRLFLQKYGFGSKK